MRYGRYAISLTFFLVFLACQKQPITIPPDKILKLQIDTNGVVAANYPIPADNYTFAQVLATTDSTVVDTTTTVMFTTDNGSFSTGGQSATVKIDLHGRASVFLRSKSAVTAHVQATVGGNYSQNIDVPFGISYPDSLFINLPDSADDLPKTRINFNTLLYKRHGSSSSGLNIGYSAFDTAGNPIGRFYNETPSDTAGNATAQFWLNSANYAGFVYVKAYVVITPGDSVKTTSAMYIVKK
jgi:hypothetical protein